VVSRSLNFEIWDSDTRMMILGKSFMKDEDYIRERNILKKYWEGK
jgi:hypothetical protein